MQRDPPGVAPRLLSPGPGAALPLTASDLVEMGLVQRGEVDRNWGVIQYLERKGWCLRLRKEAADRVTVDGIPAKRKAETAKGAPFVLVPVTPPCRISLDGHIKIHLSITSAPQAAGPAAAPSPAVGFGTSGRAEPEDAAQIERLVTDATNRARQDHGLGPLCSEARLAAVARKHSEDMCRRSFFDHQNPDGRTPADRVAVGFPEHRGGTGENIFKIDSCYDLVRSPGDVEDLSRQLIDGWMASPGHRANILRPDLVLLGVGVFATEDDVFATQLFSRPLVVFDTGPPAVLGRRARVQLLMELGPDLAGQTALEAHLKWPDPTRRFPTASGRGYWIGQQPLRISRSGSRLEVILEAGDIAGCYTLLIGSSAFWPVAAFDVR